MSVAGAPQRRQSDFVQSGQPESGTSWSGTSWPGPVRIWKSLVLGLLGVQQWLTRDGWRLSFRRRRAISFAVVVVMLALMGIATQAVDANFGRSSILTGWTLLVGLFGLTALGLRRRLPILPLGSMSTWTQIHVYWGLFLLGTFGLHAPRLFEGVALAGGWLENVLAWFFAITSGSGLYGWWSNRRIPPRLTAIAADHRFDDVGWHRHQIACAAAERIALLKSQPTVHVLDDFYELHLRRFFHNRPSLAYLVWPSTQRRRRLLSGLTQLNRYLDDSGRRTMGELAALIRRRDDLDMQFALQLRLRTWVVFHAACSLSLLLLGVVHAILATRFMGS